MIGYALGFLISGIVFGRNLLRYLDSGSFSDGKHSVAYSGSSAELALLAYMFITFYFLVMAWRAFNVYRKSD